MFEWLDLDSKERNRFTSKFQEKSFDIIYIITKQFKNNNIKLNELKSKQEKEEEKEKEKEEEDDDDENDDNDGIDFRKISKLNSRKNNMIIILSWLIIEFEEFEIIIKSYYNNNKDNDDDSNIVNQLKKELTEYLNEIPNNDDDNESNTGIDYNNNTKDPLGKKVGFDTLVKEDDQVTRDMIQHLIDNLE